MPESVALFRVRPVELGLLAVASCCLAIVQNQFSITSAPSWICTTTFGLPILAAILQRWSGLLAVSVGSIAALCYLGFSVVGCISLAAMAGEMLVIVLLCPRWFDLSAQFANPKAALHFFLLTVIGVLVRAGLVGAGALLCGLPAENACLGTLTLDWLMSLLLVPAGMVWLRGELPQSRHWLKTVECGTTTVLVAGITYYWFASANPHSLNAPIPLIAIFLSLGHWVAYRYHVRGMATLFLVVGGIILLGAWQRGTLSPVLPLDHPPHEQHLWLVSLGVLLMFHLLLASVAMDRRIREEERTVLTNATQKHADRLADVNARLALQSLEIADQAMELERQRDEFEKIARELSSNQQRLYLFESAVVNAHDAIIILEPKSKPKTGRAVLYVNDAFTRMTGYTRAEVVGRSLHMLRGEKTDLSTLLQLRQALDTENPFSGEIRNYRKCGRSFWVSIELVPVRDASDTCTHFVMIQRDITDRKHAEEALQESEMRFRTIFETTSAGVSLTDSQGLFIACNPAFAELLGRPIEDILGHSPEEFTHPEDWQKQLPLMKLVKQGTRDKFQLRKRYIRPDGSSVWSELSIATIRDSAGQYTQGLGVSLDVNTRMTLEEQLRQSQKMEALGQLAGGVAHDFNNLLTAVLGNLALVKLPDDSPAKPLLHTVEIAATRAADLTRKLLGYARRNQLLATPVMPGILIGEVVDILRRTIDPRIAIRTNIHTTETVSVDSTLINQALFNLCLNARDAMPNGGVLTLEAHQVNLEEGRLPEHPDAVAGSYVRLRVSDTGEGVPDSVKKRLFEPFFTTKGVGRGTGLGLPMVHGILKQHNGWVTFTSELGRGTCFELYLPFNREASNQTSPSRLGTPTCDINTPPPARSGATILLVDDEDMIRALARTILESHGYRVLEATDGQEGVELFRKQASEIQIVILDVTMPRLSGPDAFKQIIGIDPNARVLFSSGFSNEDISDIEGTRGVLMKPYRPKDLLTAVHRVLHDLPLTVKLAEV